MRLVIQRVNEASVSIHNQLHSAIQQGLLVLIGIEEEDNQEDIQYLVSKLIGLRIFSDAEGKMNLDIKQINGELLLVSQFTLLASTKKGNRPSFIKAAKPEKANQVYLDFISEITKQNGQAPKTGVFAADMKIALVNDGPVTIIMDSKNRE
jgi:D-aminoacyl-tRNA deacylase